MVEKQIKVKADFAIFNEVAKTIREMAIDAKYDFINNFEGVFTDFYELNYKIYETGAKAIEKAVGKAVDILEEKGEYAVNKEIFFESFYRNYFIWSDIAKYVDNTYAAMIIKETGYKEYNEVRRVKFSEKMDAYFIDEYFSDVKGKRPIAEILIKRFESMTKIFQKEYYADKKCLDLYDCENYRYLLGEMLFEAINNVNFALFDAMDFLEIDYGFSFKTFQKEILKAEMLFSRALTENQDRISCKKMLDESFALYPLKLNAYDFVMEKFSNIESVSLKTEKKQD